MINIAIDSVIIDMPAVKINVRMQGGIRVNSGFILEKSNSVVAIGIDMASKRGDVTGIISEDNIPGLLLDANEASLHLQNGKENESTEISFPQYKGWEVYCASISRYTLKICLIKIKK